MLKRFSSLILALVIGSSVLAVTARPQDEHVCQMAGMEMMPEHGDDAGGMEAMPGMDAMPGMEMMPEHGADAVGIEAMPRHGEDAGGMEIMPCCKKHKTQSVVSECCINIPQETGSSAATFNVRPPSSSVAVIHPAGVQSPLAAPKLKRSYSTEVLLPNLQASYIRNLSLLI